MRRGFSILKDQLRDLSVSEVVLLLKSALFKNERILIYCVPLQESEIDDNSESQLSLIVKGELADLERARRQLEHVPWEFKCDLYDGVRDYFAFVDARNGTIGHISWIYYAQDPNRTLRLGAKECEVMFCLTLPEYRGKGLYPSALQAVQRYLRGRGYERCFICVSDGNFSSIHGIEKSGFQYIGRTRLRKVFGFQVSRRRDTRHLRGT